MEKAQRFRIVQRRRLIVQRAEQNHPRSVRRSAIPPSCSARFVLFKAGLDRIGGCDPKR